MKGKWHIETSQAMPDPFVRKWSGRLDSNQRPLEPHSVQLVKIVFWFSSNYFIRLIGIFPKSILVYFRVF